MLRKGMKENIVVGLTNLYDHFFTRQGESRAKITAVRLPYFEGDYWPGVAEEIIDKLLPEDDDLKQQRSKLRKVTMTECANVTGDTSKDDILMQKVASFCLFLICLNISDEKAIYACPDLFVHCAAG